MAASPFEFIRRGILPSIRPPGVDQTASMDLPEEGVVSISGTGGGVVDLTFSISHSWTVQVHEEEKRRYDKMRTYYTRPDGSVDKSSYVDWEAAREITFGGTGGKDSYSKMPTAENITLIQAGLTRQS
jgi:hypothetical protein